MTSLLTLILIAASYLASSINADSTNISFVCSAISNPSCYCINTSTSVLSAHVRCTFNTSQLPSPLFSNSSFVSSVNLHTLDLSENNLDSLPDDFFHNESIITLILKENRLEVVPAVLRKLRGLKSLDLSENFLRSWSVEDVVNVPGLERLDLSANRLTALSGEDVGEVARLEDLKELNLSRNAIESINGTLFKTLPSISTLDLAHNRLSQVTQDTFWEVRTTLQNVDLSNNSLRHLDPLALQNLKILHTLSLAQNDLAEVDLGRLGFPQHLVVLDLRDCGLTSVNRCQFSRLTDLEVLDLRGNPLNCSCELLYLQKEFQNPPQSNQTHWSCQRNSWSHDTGAKESQDPLPPFSTSDSAGGWENGSGWVPVADLQGPCEDYYAVCPSVSDMISQMVTTLNVDISSDTLRITWTLQKDNQLLIDGFQLRYIPEDGDSLTSDHLPPDQRSLAMDTGDLAPHFMLCLEVLMYDSAVVHQQCQSYQEEASTMVVGILAGVVFLTPCVAALVYVFFKDHRMNKVLYKMVGNIEDEEKDSSGKVEPVSVGGRDVEAAAQDAQMVAQDDGAGQSCEDAESSDVQVVVVKDMADADGSKNQESESAVSNTSSVPKQTGDLGTSGSVKAEGIQNLGFVCQGGHAGGEVCTDPEHESTDL